LSPLAGMGIALAALGLCFAGAMLLRRLASPHPEALRKFTHVLVGLTACTFPWLFDNPWPVLLLAGISLAALLAVRGGIPILQPIGILVHGVDRISWGELLFPVAVAALFLLTGEDTLLYVVPLLILTLADAVAALIGVHYGRFHFSTLEGRKSLEGSFSFFVVTFLCVHIGVLLFTDTGRLESLLIGALMGVIVMMFEAVAWRGLDNLFIPLASFALLKIYLVQDVAELVIRLAVIVLLGLFVLFWRRRSTLDDSALVGAALVGFGAWAIGGYDWLLAPVLFFVAATVLALRDVPQQRQPVHTIHALLGISGPGLAWLVLHANLENTGVFLAYTLSFGAHLTMLGVSRAHCGHENLPVPRLVPAVAQGWFITLIPLAGVHGIGLGLFVPAAVALVGMIAAALLFLHLQPGLDDCPVTPRRWGLQAAIAGGLSAAGWFVATMVHT
jgi:phytol kinase